MAVGEDAETPTLMGGEAANLTQQGMKYLFRTSFSQSSAMPKVANYLQKTGVKSVAMVWIANDFGKGAPDEKGWTSAYSDFVGELRFRNPYARIYFAVGTMMSDSYPPNTNALTTLRRYLKEIVALREAAGDKNVSIVDFGVQDAAADGLGSDWHPSVKTHEKMAAKLAQTIKADLKW